VAAGENRDDYGEGLCIKCNKFTSCEYDIFITPQGGSDPDKLGIAEKQGEANSGGSQYDNLAAGNLFSDDTGIEFNCSNDLGCNPVKYTHHDENSTSLKIVPFPFYPSNMPSQLNIVEDQLASFSLNESCPSHLNGSGIDPSIERLNFFTESALIQNYEDTLAQRTDGGDTYGLNFEVQSSFPDEALLVRQELMDESPYLSDTVMKSAITKDDVLPNAMIRDVLVSNPQSAKSDEIVDMLDERIDPMPDYMINEIMQGENILGAKELIEKNIAFHNTLKNKALSNLIHHFKKDTISFSDRNDSIVDIFTSDPTQFSNYQLASYFIDMDDSISAFSNLEGILSNYNLTSQQQHYFNNFYNLIEFQWQTRNTLNIDSLTILSINEIAYSNQRLPGVYSRNILINQNELIYVKPVYLPSTFKSSINKPESDYMKDPDQKYLKAFPNPAGNYFIIEYSIVDHLEKGYSIQIVDISGMPVNYIELKDSQNQIVVPKAEFSNGVYIVHLLFQNSLLESIKISISK
jgi:hypothetical protein